MKPLEVIISLLPTLSQKELDRVKELLAVPIKTLSACERTGHKFDKTIHEEARGWFQKPYRFQVCLKCGQRNFI